MRRGQFASLGALALLAASVSPSPTLAAGEAGQLASATKEATRTDNSAPHAVVRARSAVRPEPGGVK